MSDARAIIVLWGALSACAGGTTSGVAPPPSRPRVASPGTAPAGAASGTAGCGADILTRRPGAEPVEGLDLDGDGDQDLVFRAGHSMHGNADFLFYRVDGACAVYLGSIEAFIVNTPSCVAPPVDGAVCRLSATVRMFHDDYQESFYALVDGTLTEVGHGRYIAPRPRPRPTR